MPISPWRMRYYIRKWKRILYKEDITERFAEAIRSSDLDTVRAMYRDPAQKMKIDPNYQDAEGNSLMHLAVLQRRWNYVTPVEELGCPNNLVNRAGRMPFDLTSNFRKTVATNGRRPEPGPFDKSGGKLRTRDDLVAEMSQYYRDDYSGAVFPGRRVTPDLNLYFECPEGRCDVPDSWPEVDGIDARKLSLHRRLAIANHLSSARADTVESMEPDPHSSNCYVTAAFSFVVSEEPYAIGMPTPVDMINVIVPINVPEHIVFSIGVDYAHAEQVLFAYINDVDVLARFAEELKAKIGSGDGHKCYAVIFDLHTSFSMCGRCEGRMYNFQGLRNDESLMVKFEDALTASGFVLPELREHTDLLTPGTARLSTSTRVSCHDEFQHESPKDGRGHQYPSFDGASGRERNVAAHRGAVVFHSTHAESADRLPYEFSKARRRSFVPCYVPDQTAFVMKPNPTVAGRRRRQWTMPKKGGSPDNPGILIMSDTASSRCQYRAKPYSAWHYIQENNMVIVQRLIRERLTDRGALAEVLLPVISGENIYHKAAQSGSVEMLEYIDSLILAHFSGEREELLRAELSPLAGVDDARVFICLIGLGAEDPISEHVARVFDGFETAHKHQIVDLYLAKDWPVLDFAEEFLVSDEFTM